MKAPDFILKSSLLEADTPSRHLFSLRDESLPGHGNVSLLHGNPEDTAQVRTELMRCLGLEVADLALAEQAHGTVILRLDETHRGLGAFTAADRVGPADGLITGAPGLAIGILVADCACLLLADTRGRCVGAFHAGWRGTLEGMAVKAVDAFREWFDVAPTDIRAWISPCISGRNYQVGPELWGRFRERWGGAEEAFLHPGSSQPYSLDLAELNALQLVQSGLSSEAVERSGLCAFDSASCFSHRRGDQPQGRMLGVIALPG